MLQTEDRLYVCVGCVVSQTSMVIHLWPHIPDPTQCTYHILILWYTPKRTDTHHVWRPRHDESICSDSESLGDGWWKRQQCTRNKRFYVNVDLKHTRTTSKHLEIRTTTKDPASKFTSNEPHGSEPWRLTPDRSDARVRFRSRHSCPGHTPLKVVVRKNESSESFEE